MCILNEFAVFVNRYCTRYHRVSPCSNIYLSAAACMDNSICRGFCVRWRWRWFFNFSTTFISHSTAADFDANGSRSHRAARVYVYWMRIRANTTIAIINKFNRWHTMVMKWVLKQYHCNKAYKIRATKNGLVHYRYVNILKKYFRFVLKCVPEQFLIYLFSFVYLCMHLTCTFTDLPLGFQSARIGIPIRLPRWLVWGK